MDERQLIRKVLKGDTSAFAYFVDTYQDMAVTIAFRICENRQDAEDIVQNAFVKAFHNLHTFRADSKFSTWFYRIVYNTALSYINVASFHTEFVDYRELNNESQSDDWNPVAQMEEHERKVIIARTLESMPKEESLILTLFYLEENSIKDVALITSLSESNVKVRLFRARKRFAELLRASVQKEIF